MTLPTKVNGSNGHDVLVGLGKAFAFFAGGDVTITEKPQHRRKKHIPIAPAGSVPSGEVEWHASCGSGLQQRVCSVRAQTWFFARAAAMAFFMCEASDLVVVRA